MITINKSDKNSFIIYSENLNLQKYGRKLEKNTHTYLQIKLFKQKISILLKRYLSEKNKMISCPICDKEKSVIGVNINEIFEDKQYFDHLDIYKCDNCDFSFCSSHAQI